MKESEVLCNIIERLKSQYIKPLLQEQKDEFDEGVLCGFSGAMAVIKNEIALSLGEERLKEYGINIDCDTFSNI